MKEKKNINIIVPKLRTNKEKKDLKASYKTLNKFWKGIVEGVLNFFSPELQKETMTGAERTKASREQKNYWELCINFIMASSHFENFVKTNKLQSKLHEIALKYGVYKDIAKMVFTVFQELNQT